ncbi:glycosyl hydrolase family 8 [Amorphus orientalis]|uniref:cellulase n=1 Tax=Amorphus orientalis TaxID=649198 RepID=A0AAE3VJQ2_9HYPH|nr:glycosyl hydrolase family 8 [Amorphus orientalis]MDQ0313614.1 endoglucanase [Amorphus orientalis]
MSRIPRLRSVVTSRLIAWAVAAVAVGSGLGPAPLSAQDLYQGRVATRLSPEFYDWHRYQATPFFTRYMKPDGRIFDPENGGISHSESQAYGMAIAFAADAPETFDLVWEWTRKTLRNPDGLHAWKYDPYQGVVDRNNATDADLIIAAMLSLAAKRWNRGDYLAFAAETAQALGNAVLVDHQGYVVMLPGRQGFMPPSQPDGPVINLSYYHFDMMQIVADLAPNQPWRQAIEAGWVFYERVLAEWNPSDWTSVRDPNHPVPAQNFAKRSSYDAIRAPINILSVEWAAHPQILDIIDNRFEQNGGLPGIYDPVSRQRTGNLTNSGYRIIAAAIDCVADGNPVPLELLNFRPETYFGSALHLMVIHQLYTKHPNCIRL